LSLGKTTENVSKRSYDPKTTEFFYRFPHYETLHSNIMSKGKRATKSIQVFLLLGIFSVPGLNRLVYHDLEKTELGLGTQNFDLTALTQLAIFLKREENKVDCMD